MATRRSSGFAAKVKMQAVTAWSFSRYKDYQKCPAFFGFKHVRKIKEAANAAMNRGTAVHKGAEDYLTGHLEMLPPDLARFKKEFKSLKAHKPEAELSLTWTKNWEAECEATDWDKAWIRIKVDALYQSKEAVKIIDFKTGKIYDDVREQLELYGIAGLLHFPNAPKAEAEAWYVDQGEIVDETYERKSLPKLIKAWDKKTKAMLTDTTFKPHPGSACGYCPYAKGKGGPCAF